ncbi:arsenate reductase family protein [Virgibacillus sp. W0430]|uniref:arsenate reductase family protein n=1 Tax=Virgibacillus sp. W0430 TaxID=3391580 RepID=UPI003F47EB5B
MTLTFNWYPNCNSCNKAKKWLEKNNLNYESVHIVENPPTKEELLALISNSELHARKFFNTSGKVYREQNMKEKIKNATEEEMATYLASNGMLIKRPIITDGNKVTVGFNEQTLEETWLRS